MRAVVFRYTEAEVLEASRVLYRMMPIMRLSRWVIAILLFYEIVALVLALRQGTMDRVGAEAGWLVTGLAVVGFMVVADRVIIPGRLRKALVANPIVMADSMLTWSQEGFSLRNSLGETKRRWGDVFRWRESRHCLLLYEDEAVCQNVPKRALTGEQAAEIRGYLQAAIGPAGRKRA